MIKVYSTINLSYQCNKILSVQTFLLNQREGPSFFSEWESTGSSLSCPQRLTSFVCPRILPSFLCCSIGKLRFAFQIKFQIKTGLQHVYKPGQLISSLKEAVVLANAQIGISHPIWEKTILSQQSWSLFPASGMEG